MNPLFLINSARIFVFLFLFQFSFGQTKLFTPAGEFTTNCEGPSVDASGNIYAVNIQEDGTIARISPKGKTEVFLKLPNGSIGNGIRFGDVNTFYVADFKGHNVLKVSLQTKTVSVHCHEPAMNQPNDLTIAKSGAIFCSDPNWAKSTGQIWYVSPEGKAVLAEANMGTTNGIELSPDEKILYVNESVQRNIWAFDVNTDGQLSNKRLLLTFEDGGMDGMRCDIEGNLYVTRWGKGEVAVISPKGKLLRTIKTQGLKTSNIAFGGKDGKTCFVTLQDTKQIETFRANKAGREHVMMKHFKAKKQ